MKRRKNNKGFTLVELIVVIAIIGILVAIAVPRMTNTLDAAYHATLETNMKNVETVVLLHMMDLNDDHIYDFKGYGKDSKKEYLSAILEEYLENDGGTSGNDLDNDNDDCYKNPLSGKVGVVNFGTDNNSGGIIELPTSHKGVEGFYYQQAIYLTNDSNFSFYNNTTTQSNLLKYVGGAVVVYFDEDAKQIQIFYVDQDGVKSDHVTTY